MHSFDAIESTPTSTAEVYVPYSSHHPACNCHSIYFVFFYLSRFVSGRGTIMRTSTLILLLAAALVIIGAQRANGSCTDVPSNVKCSCGKTQFRWFYMPDSGTCQKYRWRGCGCGRLPGFGNRSLCIKARCGCDRKPRRGPCRGIDKGFYFDSKQKVSSPVYSFAISNRTVLNIYIFNLFHSLSR